MGTGYVRNDTANNIADGNIINAADFDGEYDAIEAAFNASTGHTHDGTSAEGAPIEVVGPSQDVVITASAMRPKTTNTVDLGTSSLEFKDAYFDGTITTDALTVTDGITSDTVTILSENAGAAKGPQLDIFRDSASPADNDVLGHIDFSGKDDGDNKTIYASILAEAADVTDTTEDGVLKINTMVAGTDTTIVTVDADGLTVDGDTSSKITIESTNTSGETGILEFYRTNAAHAVSQIVDEREGDLNGGKLNFKTSDTSGSMKLRMDIDQGGDISFYEDTGTTPKFFWDASAERLGIGTTSPSSKVHIVGATSAERTLIIEDTFGNDVQIQASVSSGNASMVFKTEDTERMRIDSSGNLLVGTTDTTLYNNTTGNGFMVFGSGGVHVAKESSGTTDPALLLNNTGDDGQVIRIAKDGATVGSIGASSGNIVIGNGDTGVMYWGGDAILPWNISTNAERDGAISMGRSGGRFKDLYLSGGVYLGGTGSANHLDDYEEGTWTPAITAGSGGSSIVSGTNTATYTKIGRLVFCQVRTNCSSSSNSRLHISNLPFTNAGGNAQLGVMSKHGTNGGSFYALSAGEFAAYSYDGGIFTAQDAHGVFRASFTYETS